MYVFTLYVLSSVLRIQSLYASLFSRKCFHFDIHLLPSLLSFREVKTSSLFNSSTSALISYLHGIFLTHSKKITHSPNEIAVTSRLNIYLKLTTACHFPYMHLSEKTHPKIRMCETASILPEFKPCKPQWLRHMSPYLTFTNVTFCLQIALMRFFRRFI
jgi:hypothetical protein